MSEGRRVKRWAPKVFSGCQTCKRRRIKCDEAKPTCQRCARSSLQCEGYAPPTARMFEPGKKAERAASQERGLVIRQNPATIPSSSPFKSPDETHSFEFYMRKTADLISLYSHRHFWTIIIPQATHQHTAIKHSLLALSTLHECLSRTDNLSEEFNTRLYDHYNKAIRAFTQRPPATDIVLITCILFWTVENFNGSGQPSFDHMKAAHKILGEFKVQENHTESPHYDLINTYIEPIIIDGVQHARAFGPEQVTDEPTELDTAVSAEDMLPARLPTKFTSLVEANSHLRSAIKTLLHILNDDVSAETSETLIERVDLHLRRWIYLFHSLTAVGSCCNRRMLVVHHVNASILLGEVKKAKDMDLLEDEEVRRHYQWNVKEIEDLLGDRLSVLKELSPTHDLGVVPPLFTAAIRCSDPEVRSRALEVLKSLKREEGHWTDDMAARIAQMIVLAQAEGNSDVNLKHISLYASEYGLGIYSKEPVFDRFLGVSEEELKQYDMAALNAIVHNYGYQLDRSLHESPGP